LNRVSTGTVLGKIISEYEIYPNPTQGTVQIRYTGSEEANKMTFTLYDIVGNKIMVKEGLGNYSYISIPPTANGIYTYTITNGSEIVKRDKLLLER
jgi:spore coat protein U-like protein